MLILQVGFISSHLMPNKLFPVNPKVTTGPPEVSLLLEAKSMPSLIIKLSLILVVRTDDLGWNIMSNHQQQMFIQYLNRIVSRPSVTPRQILQCTTNRIPINLMFKETFLLTHKFGMARVIKMTADREE